MLHNAYEFTTGRAADPDVKRDYSDTELPNLLHIKKPDPKDYKETDGPKAHTIISTN